MLKLDIIGDRYGRLVVLKELNKRYGKKKEKMFLCQCDCGNKTEVPIRMLRSGGKKSCGCFQREARYAEYRGTSGLTMHPLFHTWYNMRRRCYDKDSYNYRNYGAKGVVMEDRWIDNVDVFIKDIEENLGPKKQGYTIDRIDPNGNYYLDNIRWATDAEQALNKRVRASSGEDYISKSERGYRLTINRKGNIRESYNFKSLDNAKKLRDDWLKEYELNPKKWIKQTVNKQYKRTTVEEVFNIDKNKYISKRDYGAYEVALTRQKAVRKKTKATFEEALELRNKWLLEYYEDPEKWVEDTINKTYVK